ncbi:MAG: hypothetical protein P4L46_03550 [Fimbriimonas sp.]|nr:hypothetical protein [Fimbriimonas sp.]
MVPSFFRNIPILGVLAIASLAAGSRAGDTEVWVSTAWGTGYDLQDVLRGHPNLKRVYLPLFQMAPSLTDKPFATPETYLQKLAGSYEMLHARGIEVFGVFTPLRLDDAAQAVVRPEWCEQPYATAFDKAKPTPWLSIYHPQVAAFCERTLAECLSRTKIDGVVLNLAYSASVYLGYSQTVREDTIRRLGFDPVDIDYPLGPPFDGRLKDQSLIDDLVNDRALATRKLIDSLAGVCKNAGRKFGVFGSLNIYDYAVSTQVAALGDWATVLHDHPSAFAVLAMVQGDAMSANNLRQFVANATSHGIDLSLLRVLTGNDPAERTAIAETNEPRLTTTLMLRKN